MALAAAATAGVCAGAAYLNARYHLGKDLSTILALKRAERDYQKQIKNNRVNVWYILEERCNQHWDRRAIWSRNGCWTFGQVYEQVNKYSEWLLEQGIRPGELVGMYMTNTCEFIIVWFACLAIGAAPAFLNYNLEGQALLHCLKVCETKLLIVDEDAACQQRMKKNRQEIEGKGAKIVVLDQALKQTIDALPPTRPGDELRSGTTGDFPFCLIYTSGTTGLPKGCAFTQARTRLLGSHSRPAFDGKPAVDQWYCAMPLYHGTGAISTALAMLGGLSVAIAPRFSVSRFWDDIHDSGSTIFIYVGETARYLLNAPPHPLETKHRLRLAYGNGLRPDVWVKLQRRFKIPEIAEFFNSTEGLFALVVWSKNTYFDACVGHHGLLLRTLLHNVYIPVAIDHETGDIWHDTTGFARRTSYDEGGEILVKVSSKADFQGYWRNPTATDKKFAANVFADGDLYYRCGDALRRSNDGRWFFMDRLGDTFRWKSENVSTAEVSECLGKYPGVAEANVYGVLVPNHEGRAGCAALHLSQPVDYDDVLSYLTQRLPRYAVPVFLRVVKASTHIHNHKQNKVPLRKEGVDPMLVGTEDPVGREDTFLWLPPKGARYEPFTHDDWKRLEAAQARL